MKGKKADPLKRIEEIVEDSGSWRAAAAQLGIESSYLWRIAKGERPPPDDLLAKLGIERHVTYTRIES